MKEGRHQIMDRGGARVKNHHIWRRHYNKRGASLFSGRLHLEEAAILRGRPAKDGGGRLVGPTLFLFNLKAHLREDIKSKT